MDQKLNSDLISEITTHLDQKDKSRLRCVCKTLSETIPKISEIQQEEYFYQKVSNNASIISKLMSETLNFRSGRLMGDYLVANYDENIINYSQLLKLLKLFCFISPYDYHDRIYVLVGSASGTVDYNNMLLELCLYAFGICSDSQLVTFYHDVKYLIVMTPEGIEKEPRNTLKKYLIENITNLIAKNSECIYEQIYYCLK